GDQPRSYGSRPIGRIPSSTVQKGGPDGMGLGCAGDGQRQIVFCRIVQHRRYGSGGPRRILLFRVEGESACARSLEKVRHRRFSGALFGTPSCSWSRIDQAGFSRKKGQLLKDSRYFTFLIQRQNRMSIAHLPVTMTGTGYSFRRSDNSSSIL